MYSKNHLTVVSKQLEPLVFRSSLSSRTVLPAIIRPYQQPSFSSSTFSTSSETYTSNKRQVHTASLVEEYESPRTSQFHFSQRHLQPLPIYDFFAANEKIKKPDYIFAHGASGFAKRRQQKKRRPYHPPQQHFYSEQMGEDAFFTRCDSFGISDGVGGWSSSQAADPALFARQLMHHAYLELERYDNVDDPCFYHYDDVDPVQILQKSYEASLLEAEKEGIVGSCTACLAILRHDELRIANLGDCGISVIRHNNYIFRSEEQQHSFNFPYQLGTGSPDQPKDAQVFNVKVEKNDIIIMGSDGLYDNLFDKEILSIIEAQVAPYILPGMNKTLQFEPQRLSDALANRAKVVSDNRRNIDSPFQTRAIHEGFYYQGGKVDDISVVVAVVRDSEDSPDRRL
ncbi:phosphatase 2C-like domain-containing protein [Halteromyces radiatus]|uniref:phosphatase 2C-like domain-containing protein n=1 Tax=Halteromyces radiatus TaxID=101107 RepID=UPI00221EF47D|nr:phosphatase 2C-like domain-containing protein [Halteromyces radiatus]KAI8093862.1 phosphatase 2C-like domain-containing protein [Halteromyces radiatus]